MLGGFLQAFDGAVAGSQGALEHVHSGFGASGGVFGHVVDGTHEGFLCFSGFAFEGVAKLGAGGRCDFVHVAAIGSQFFSGGLVGAGLQGQDFLDVFGAEQGVGVAGAVVQSGLGGSDGLVDPALNRFDFTGICSRYIDSNGYSLRVGEEDLASRYRLRLEQQGIERQLMFIVLNNLLENACKYAPANTPIHVTLQHAADQPTVRLIVRNQPRPNGWPDADRVFDKYYRSPQAQRQAGTGLGLFLVRNLMQVLGGHIAYLPNEEEVRFVICLPLATSVN